MMAGQLVKRGEKKYLVRVFVGRDPETGKRCFLNRTVRGTKKEAEQVRTALLREKDLGTLALPVKMSFNSLLDKWLTTAVKPRVSERTHREYEWKANRYIRPKLGERLLNSIKPLDIQTLYSDMLARKLSPKTIRHCQNIIHNAYEQAIRWQLTSTNPAHHVDLPKKQHREMVAMTEQEAARFLTAAKSDTLHVLFELMLATGLRPSEAVALKWSDLNASAKTLSVQRTIVRPKGGGWRFDSTKTKKGTRTLTLPDGLVQTLLQHRIVSVSNDHDLIFTTLTGEALDIANVRNRHFRDVQSRAGLEGFNLYSLRHTHATLLLLAGVHPKVVSERLGHATIAITLDTYSHVLPNMQQEAAQRLEALLYKKAKNSVGKALN